jgi:hypothetical protein
MVVQKRLGAPGPSPLGTGDTKNPTRRFRVIRPEITA